MNIGRIGRWQIANLNRRGHSRQHSAGRAAKGKAGRGLIDRASALVNEPVVGAAQADQVRESGFSPIGPVLDVVTVDDEVIAARELAALVAMRQRPANL